MHTLGKLVRGRLLAYNTNDGTARLSLKSIDVDGNKKLQDEIALLTINEVINGTIEKVSDHGVFVKLHGTNITGLSRKPDALGQNSDRLHEKYRIGDIVRARVLSTNPVLKKVGLGLKESYFRDYDPTAGRASITTGEEGPEGEGGEGMDVDEEEDTIAGGEVPAEVGDEEAEDQQEEEEDEDEEPIRLFSKSKVSVVKQAASSAMIVEEDGDEEGAADTPFAWDDFQGDLVSMLIMLYSLIHLTQLILTWVVCVYLIHVRVIVIMVAIRLLMSVMTRMTKKRKSLLKGDPRNLNILLLPLLLLQQQIKTLVHRKWKILNVYYYHNLIVVSLGLNICHIILIVLI